MRKLLFLILLLFGFVAYGQPERVLKPTSYTTYFMTNSSAADARTYLGVEGGSTNGMQQLGGMSTNQTATGLNIAGASTNSGTLLLLGNVTNSDRVIEGTNNFYLTTARSNAILNRAYQATATNLASGLGATNMVATNLTVHGITSPGSYGVSSEQFGSGANASAIDSTAVGYNVSATGAASTSVGAHSGASGPNSSALGEGAVANNVDTIAIGYQAHASSARSIAIGNGVSTTDTNQLMLGPTNYTVVMPGSCVTSNTNTAAFFVGNGSLLTGISGGGGVNSNGFQTNLTVVGSDPNYAVTLAHSNSTSSFTIDPVLGFVANSGGDNLTGDGTNGTAIPITAGSGGAASGGSGNGGNGAPLNFTSGTGGGADASSGNSGNGGPINITAANAGSYGAGNSGNGGPINLTSGTGDESTTGSTNGPITLNSAGNVVLNVDRTANSSAATGALQFQGATVLGWSSGAVNVAGSVTASTFVGDGGGLTNISTSGFGAFTNLQAYPNGSPSITAFGDSNADEVVFQVFDTFNGQPVAQATASGSIDNDNGVWDFKYDGTGQIEGPIAQYTAQVTSIPAAHNVPGVTFDLESIHNNNFVNHIGPELFFGNLALLNTNFIDQSITNLDLNMGNPDQYYLSPAFVFGVGSDNAFLGVSNIVVHIETQDVESNLRIFKSSSIYTNYVVSDGDHCFFDGRNGHIRKLSFVGPQATWIGHSANGLTANGIGASNFWDTIAMPHHWTEQGTNWIICFTNGVFRSNVVMNTFFTNTYEVPVIFTPQNSILTLAGVAGYSQLTLLAPGVATNRISQLTAVSGLTGSVTNSMGSITLLPWQMACFTNTSTSGNSATADTYQITTQ